MLELYKSLYTVLSARATTQIFIKLELISSQDLYKVHGNFINRDPGAPECTSTPGGANPLRFRTLR